VDSVDIFFDTSEQVKEAILKDCGSETEKALKFADGMVALWLRGSISFSKFPDGDLQIKGLKLKEQHAHSEKT